MNRLALILLATALATGCASKTDITDRDDALACARASVGTDVAIVDCFHAQGLPAPDDLS